MPDCSRCGAHVSTRFVRVFGLSENGVVACPSCSGRSHIADTILERH